MIIDRHTKGEMIQDIAARIGINKLLVGAYLRSQGINTLRGPINTSTPSLSEIHDMARKIKEHNLAKMREGGGNATSD